MAPPVPATTSRVICLRDGQDPSSLGEAYHAADLVYERLGETLWFIHRAKFGHEHLATSVYHIKELIDRAIQYRRFHKAQATGSG